MANINALRGDNQASAKPITCCFAIDHATGEPAWRVEALVRRQQSADLEKPPPHALVLDLPYVKAHYLAAAAEPSRLASIASARALRNAVIESRAIIFEPCSPAQCCAQMFPLTLRSSSASYKLFYPRPFAHIHKLTNLDGVEASCRSNSKFLNVPHRVGKKPGLTQLSCAKSSCPKEHQSGRRRATPCTNTERFSFFCQH